MNNLTPYFPEFEKAITHVKSDISGLRTNRANPDMVEKVVVEAYGTPTPLVQLASIAVPEARSIVIMPWDKSLLKDIEKGILAANLGLNPVNEGTQLRISMPQLTEESRKDLVKLLNQKLEQGRQVIRKLRDKIREEINATEKAKEISEDKKFELLKELDEKTQEFNEKIKKIGEEKEKEITTI
ncbi:MAG: ribosome recycling factor [Candidatus Buchananbacteria bacterium]